MPQKDQIDSQEHIITMNVLILSDRLHEYALMLAGYMKGHTDIHILGIAKNTDEAISLARNETVDFLVIAGYLMDTESYCVIEKLRTIQKKVITVHWAILDKLIIYYCYRYNIEEKFDRRLPLPDFINYLKELYQLHTFWEIPNPQNFE